MGEWDYFSQLFLDNVAAARAVDRNTLVGRCNVCGDSKVSKHKKRLYLMNEIGTIPIAVKCHNCGYSASANNYFKTYFPQDEDTMNKLAEIAKKRESTPPPKKMSFEKNYDLELDRAKRQVGKFWETSCMPIENNPIAFEYMKNRNVPEEYIKDMRVLRPEYCVREYKYNYYSRYIMVPFIDMRDDKVYYFHARSFVDDPNSKLPKFLSCPYKQYYTDHKIYYYLNEHFVNLNETIFVVEGTIDSLNIENSICVNGISKINDRLIEEFEERYGGSDNVVYVLDNELIDEESTKKSDWLLRKNKKVFLWSELAKINSKVKDIKDINQLCCLAGRTIFPKETIMKCVKSSIVQKLERE